MGFGPTPAENGESTVRILREKNLKLQKRIKNGKEKNQHKDKRKRGSEVKQEEKRQKEKKEKVCERVAKCK